MENRKPAEQQARILLVDDERNLVTMLGKILRRQGHDVVLAENGEDALRQVALTRPPGPDEGSERDPEAPFDAIVSDLQMPRMDGMTLLRELKEHHPEIPVVVLTGHGSIESAVEAMKIGAYDYIIKPCNPDEIILVLQRAIEASRLKTENRSLREKLHRYEPSAEIIGRSLAIRGVLKMVESVARNRSNVLITGESGTGKELIARAIHDSGPYARYPFIAVNCGALSETLLESQLFGHRRGAFTGAVLDHIGFFQAAENGTLFLDEISEMSPHLQVKLLRAIQQHEIIPVGDTQPIKVNVRMICATNRDLEFEVRQATFRQDLFYRLNVVNIHVDALRERAEDIPLLINHFILLYAKEYDVAPKSVAGETMELLMNYPWPGNIRELQNVIERSFALSDAEMITNEDLPANLFRESEDALSAVRPLRPMPTAQSLTYVEDTAKPARREPIPAPNRPNSGPARPMTPFRPQGAPSESSVAVVAVASEDVAEARKPFVPTIPEGPLTLDEVEKRQIQDALRRAKGKKIEAARILGIDRKRLARKIKKYELD